MTGNRVLAGEFVIAVGFIAWQDLKWKYLPWPGTIARVCAAFAILGIVSAASEELAAALGGGFLLAAFLRFYQSGHKGPYGMAGLAGQDPPYAPGGLNVNQHGATVPVNYIPIYFGGTS